MGCHGSGPDIFPALEHSLVAGGSQRATFPHVLALRAVINLEFGLSNLSQGFLF